MWARFKETLYDQNHQTLHNIEALHYVTLYSFLKLIRFNHFPRHPINVANKLKSSISGDEEGGGLQGKGKAEKKDIVTFMSA